MLTDPPPFGVATGDVSKPYAVVGPNSTYTEAVAGGEMVYWATMGFAATLAVGPLGVAIVDVREAGATEPVGSGSETLLGTSLQPVIERIEIRQTARPIMISALARSLAALRRRVIGLVT
jgi:hypothetical protein